MNLELDELLNTFEHHTPSPDQITRIQSNREAFKQCAIVVVNNCPKSADRTVSLRNLHEAMMTANKSIVLEKK